MHCFGALKGAEAVIYRDHIIGRKIGRHGVIKGGAVFKGQRACGHFCLVIFMQGTVLFSLARERIVYHSAVGVDPVGIGYFACRRIITEFTYHFIVLLLCVRRIIAREPYDLPHGKLQNKQSVGSVYV